jgi:hypothetical protein
MDIDRFAEIAAEIDSLLAQPMPPPAEKHLLREKIFALKYEQLGLLGVLPEPEQDQQARDFTLAKVPQRWASYPMHLREVCMPPRRDIEQARREYMMVPKQPPTSPEKIQKQREELIARWGRSPDKK